MNIPNFVYIWQYSINLDFEAEFLTAYQADGEWAKLFSSDSNYIRTELLQDSTRRDLYMTIDHWTSESARDSFKEAHSTEFEELDEKCEAFTLHEVLIGDFVINGTGAT